MSEARLTDKQREALVLFIKLRWQHLRLWFVSWFGVLTVVILSDVMSKGIRGAHLHLPNLDEILISVALTFIATLLDDERGGDKLARNPKAWARMKRSAFIIGLAALGTVKAVIGGHP